MKNKKVTEFFMFMKPPTVTAQQRRVASKSGKQVFYDTPEIKAAKTKFMAHLGKHIPDKQFKGPVRLIVKWCFPITGKRSDGQYKDTRPDTDNLQKLLKDCMTDCGYWKDDAQVASEIIEKFWAKVPGIYIKIAELAQNDEIEK